MNYWGVLKKIFRFGTRGKQFSLGNESWERPGPEQPQPEPLFKDLAKNRSLLEEVFNLPTNQDIVIRDFLIPSLDRKAFIIYIDGLADRNTQSFAILQPLMVLTPNEVENIKEPIVLA